MYINYMDTGASSCKNTMHIRSDFNIISARKIMIPIRMQVNR